MFGDMHCRNCILKVLPVSESNGENGDETSSGFDSCSQCQNCLAVLISTCKNDEKEMEIIQKFETCFEASNQASSDKPSPWYLDINTAEICFGPCFSNDSDKRRTFEKKTNKKSISREYDLSLSRDGQNFDKDKYNNRIGSISPPRLSVGMKNRLKDPMNSPEVDCENSIPPFGSPVPVENAKLYKSRRIIQFLLYVICLLSICSLIFSQYKVLLLESRVKYLEETFNNRLGDFELRQDEIVPKLAQIQARIEETVEKQVLLTINSVSGQQCYAIANNCAWNLVTTTPASLVRKLAGS